MGSLWHEGTQTVWGRETVCSPGLLQHVDLVHVHMDLEVFQQLANNGQLLPVWRDKRDSVLKRVLAAFARRYPLLRLRSMSAARTG